MMTTPSIDGSLGGVANGLSKFYVVNSSGLLLK